MSLSGRACGAPAGPRETYQDTVYHLLALKSVDEISKSIAFEKGECVHVTNDELAMDQDIDNACVVHLCSHSHKSNIKATCAVLAVLVDCIPSHIEASLIKGSRGCKRCLQSFATSSGPGTGWLQHPLQLRTPFRHAFTSSS